MHHFGILNVHFKLNEFSACSMTTNTHSACLKSCVKSHFLRKVNFWVSQFPLQSQTEDGIVGFPAGSKFLIAERAQ